LGAFFSVESIFYTLYNFCSLALSLPLEWDGEWAGRIV
jgi:hypothetical protein